MCNDSKTRRKLLSVYESWTCTETQRTRKYYVHDVYLDDI